MLKVYRRKQNCLSFNRKAKGDIQKVKMYQPATSAFTIIEVLIVLAIAGLILLIVFLAVPTLQRNQRNNARKSEVGRLLSDVETFESNNSGNLPTCSTYPCYSYTTNGAELGTIMSMDNFNYITFLQIYYAPNSGIHNYSGSLYHADLAIGETCGAYDMNNTYVYSVPTANSVMIVYGIETSDGGVEAVCIDT